MVAEAGMTAVFPWFAMARNWVSVFTHTVFDDRARGRPGGHERGKDGDDEEEGDGGTPDTLFVVVRRGKRATGGIELVPWDATILGPKEGPETLDKNVGALVLKTSSPCPTGMAGGYKVITF